MKITRRYRFSASHRLHAPCLSDERNAELYGRCNNPFGHGHDYIIEVQADGRVDLRTGLVIDHGKMDRLVRRSVVEVFDHRNLNTDVPWLKGCIPTAENLALIFWERIQPELPEGLLRSVRVWETEKNWAEVGDQS